MKYPIEQVLELLKYEVKMTRRVYSKMVEDGTRTQDQMDMRIEILQQLIAEQEAKQSLFGEPFVFPSWVIDHGFLLVWRPISGEYLRLAKGDLDLYLYDDRFAVYKRNVRIWDGEEIPKSEEEAIVWSRKLNGIVQQHLSGKK